MRAQVFRYALPLRKPLTLRGQHLSERTGFLLKLSDTDGSVGWGDAAPLPGFSRESMDECETALRAFAALAAERTFSDLFDDHCDVRVPRPNVPASVSFAMESALFSSAMTHYETTETPAIRCNALLGGGRKEVLAKAGTLKEKGFNCAKLKVGSRALAEDVKLVHEVWEILGPDCGLRLDANRAWNLETACAFAKQIRACTVEYIEEPLQDPLDLPRLQEEAGLSYALDETIQALPATSNTRELLDHILTETLHVWRGAKAWVWKPTLLHAPMLHAALTGLAKGLECGGNPAPKLVLSASFESGVGIAALARYAANAASADTPAGLDTYEWLAKDVLLAPLPISGGRIDLNAVASAAVHVNERVLASIAENRLTGTA